jgi:hypothetical protein
LQCFKDKKQAEIDFATLFATVLTRER